jgi:hypothetical protein
MKGYLFYSFISNTYREKVLFFCPWTTLTVRSIVENATKMKRYGQKCMELPLFLGHDVTPKVTF